MTRELRRVWFCWVVATLANAAVQAQVVRLGTEFQVNTHTTDRQWLPSVATTAGGDFVVVWESVAQDGGSYGVFAQRFTSAGAAVGGEFQVNTHTVDVQGRPSAAAAADGSFVVAWESRNQDGPGRSVFAQRLSSTGTPLASEFQVNTHTLQEQRYPSVAATADGEFVVVWESQQDGSGFGVFGHRFSSTGDPLASEFQINVVTANYQSRPRVALDGDGDFVVAWQDFGQDGSGYGVFARIFASSGVAQGGEIQVNTHFTGAQESPDVVADAAGNFLVAWGSAGGQDGSLYGVFARRFTSAGTPVGGEFQVNSHTSLTQRFPSLALDADGAFVVTWASVGQDGSGSYGVFARRFSSAGAALTPDFQVSTFTVGYQRRPDVASRSTGEFVVAWSSSRDGSVEGVFAQRFALFSTLDVDANGQLAALSDGLLILRSLFGLTGGPLTNGAVGAGCQRCDAASIQPYLSTLGSSIDIDGNGSLGALSDGLLILRWMFGLTGTTLTNGVIGGGCTRCDAAAVVPYLAGLAG